MSDDRWNDDVIYAFSIHRTLLRILGLWPFQKKTIFTITQWGLTVFLQFMAFPYLFMEFTQNHHDAGASIESILFLSCITVSLSKYFSLTMNERKFARNIDAAIDDWLYATNDEESYKILKKYTFKSRLFTLMMLYLACAGLMMFVTIVLIINLKQIYFQETINASISETNWLFIIPSGKSLSKVTKSQCLTINVIQLFQMLVLTTSQVIIDGVYISFTLHLTSQLEILQMKFKTFANKPDTEANHRKHLISLINRHCNLMELNKNLEDIFHVVILIQLVVIAILLGLIGFRIVLCLRAGDYVELGKSILCLVFLFSESVIYTCGADFLEKGHENILDTLFATPWFTLPAPLMKDVHFVIAKACYPVRLTGGKFFYANRGTLLYVFKTAASYISVLRIALRD